MTIALLRLLCTPVKNAQVMRAKLIPKAYLARLIATHVHRQSTPATAALIINASLIPLRTPVQLTVALAKPE